MHDPQTEGITTIRRCPVGTPASQPRLNSDRPDVVNDLLDDYFTLPVPGHVRPDCEDIRSHPDDLGTPILASPIAVSLSTPALASSLGSGTALTPDTPGYLSPSTPLTPALDTASPASGSKPFWKAAIDETVYLAGGLISHPAESTKHFTVLRHSPGLVYYKGPSTSVAITVFSDDGPLPPGRTLWLQRKGYSGNMGMDASTFFRTDSNWIDVTPSAQILPSEIPPEDERAWQRDIKKFMKKAADHKRLSKHRPCETCVIRVPASAADGYMRIVVCGSTGKASANRQGATQKKKSLCPSPVFRIASTSRDMSIVRGAGIKTLPLELGIRAATAIGERYVTTVAAPVVGAVQKGAKRIEPMVMSKNPRTVALVKAGASQSLGLGPAEDRYAPIQHTAWDALCETEISESPPETVGSDDGPSEPFPIHLSGRVVKGSGQSAAQIGFPTANLAGVSGDLLLRLGGVYIGWAGVKRQRPVDGPLHIWYKAIIMIGPPMFGGAQVAVQNIAAVHLIQESGPTIPDFLDSKVDVVMMAYLRPLLPRDPLPPPAKVAGVMRDNIQTAVASMSRDAWHHRHQQHLVTGTSRNLVVRSLKSHKSFSDMASQANAGLQRRVDSIPLHWAGVRTTGNELKDYSYGLGGFYIKRL